MGTFRGSSHYHFAVPVNSASWNLYPGHPMPGAVAARFVRDPFPQCPPEGLRDGDGAAEDAGFDVL